MTTDHSTLPMPILDALACFSSAAACRDFEDRIVLLRQAHDDLSAAINAHVEDRVRAALSEVDRIRESLDDDETATIVRRVMGRPA